MWRAGRDRAKLTQAMLRSESWRLAVVLATIGCAAGCDGKRSADRGSPAVPSPPAAPPAMSPAFHVPDAAARREAIGDLDEVPAEQRALFDPAGFEPIEAPAPGDWLAEHAEPGQSFRDYVRGRRNLVAEKRRTLYLLPIGGLERPGSPDIATLAEYAGIYFGLPVKTLEPVAVEQAGARERLNPHSGERQILSTDVLTYLERTLPADAYALIALTDIDLYPDPSWNFVFGQASLMDRVGVFSFARYVPGFGGGTAEGDPAPLVLRRSLKVMVHEVGHMFGIHHCIWFRCVMNGSNHLAETDTRPHHLCPVDLHKVWHATRVDPADRYRRLARFYRKVGMDAEADRAARELD
jgi:archaemetzincin